MSEVPTISRDELRALMQERRVTVVDALAAHHYHHIHLPGAINLPLGELRRLAPRLLPDKDSEIVVYCATFT